MVYYCLLILGIPSVTVGAYQEERAVVAPFEARGHVLDIFDGRKVLLSIGSNQGARKGMKGFLLRTQPGLPQGFYQFELVEVGANHSVARQTGFPYYDFPDAKFAFLRQDDSVRWIVLPEAKLMIGGASEPRKYSFRELPSSPYLNSGGAIIDLTTPAGRQLLPRK